MRLTDVVKQLLIINVLMYFGTKFLMGEPSAISPAMEFSDLGRYMLAVFFPTSEFFRPFQIVTYMFMHGDLMHLFFNMFALFMFGSAIEMSWGPKKFLFYYFFTAFGALILQWIVQYLTGGPIDVPMLGASGAVFGLLAAFGMQFPDSRIQLIFPPIPMKAKYFVLIYAGLELFLGLGNFQTGVAHFAHIGGALFGALLILYWRKTGEQLY